MKNIQVVIAERVASVVGKPEIICGNSDYTITFTFDAEWDTIENKIARFVYRKNGLKKFIPVPINGNTCKVPKLINVELVTVGVYAGDLRTTTGANIRCKKSVLCDTAEEETEEYANLYNEMLKGVKDYVDKTVVAQVKEDCTPEKGVDYFTEEDKEELVADVLYALPVWNGGAY